MIVHILTIKPRLRAPFQITVMKEKNQKTRKGLNSVSVIFNDFSCKAKMSIYSVVVNEYQHKCKYKTVQFWVVLKFVM